MLNIDYQLQLENGRRIDIRFILNETDVSQASAAPSSTAESLDTVQEPAEWTALEFCQCDHCPLTPQQSPDCPAILSLIPVVQELTDVVSHEQVGLTVTTAERVISQTTTAQRAVGSLTGLALASSGCPYTDFFRPMARFHLPLASPEETYFRSFSSYFLAQYFRQHAGLSASFDLSGLEGIYKNIERVNKGLAARLRAATEQDSMVNAVVVLDMLAKSFTLAADEVLEELTGLYQPYLNQP